MILGIVLGSVALGLAIIALSLAIMLVRRSGSRDPMMVPKFLRKALYIKPVEDELYDDYATPRDGTNEVVAFIVNPTKEGAVALREKALRACSIRYMPQPMWLYTTADDAGAGIAQKAIDKGADVLVAVGGDGTVREVAAVAAEAKVPMGIIPMGTGNILARNLEMPLSDASALLRAVLEGEDKRIDVGWLELDKAKKNKRPSKHIFLVIAGAGLDAEMVAAADDGAKRHLGWVAYIFALVRHMGAKRMEAKVTVDQEEPVDSLMRTVLFANCGKLPGGLQLVPDASFDDGKLDVATIDARGGVVGWTELFGTVVAQGAGIKQPDIPKSWRASRIDHVRGTSIELRMATPQKVQADGDPLGKASVVRGWVDPGALTVRLPAKAKEQVKAASKEKAERVRSTKPKKAKA